MSKKTHPYKNNFLEYHHITSNTMIDNTRTGAKKNNVLVVFAGLFHQFMIQNAS